MIDLSNLSLFGVSLNHPVGAFSVFLLLVQRCICVLKCYARLIKSVVAITRAARVKHLKLLKVHEAALLFAEQYVGEQLDVADVLEVSP